MKKRIHSLLNTGIGKVVKWAGGVAITVFIASVVLARLRPPPPPGSTLFKPQTVGQPKVRILDDPNASKEWRTRAFKRQKTVEEILSVEEILPVEKVLSQYFHLKGENPRKEILPEIAWRFINNQEAEHFLDSLVSSNLLNPNSQNLIDYLVHLHNLYLKKHNPARKKFNAACFSADLKLPEEGLIQLQNDSLQHGRFLDKVYGRVKEALLVTEASKAYDAIESAQSLLNKMELHALELPRELLRNPGQPRRPSFDDNFCWLIMANESFLCEPTNPWGYDFLAYTPWDYPGLSQEEFREQKSQLTADFTRWYSIIHRKNQLLKIGSRDAMQRYIFEREVPLSGLVNSVPTLNTTQGKLFLMFWTLLAANPEPYRHLYLEARERANILFHQPTPHAIHLNLINEMAILPEVQPLLQNQQNR